MGEDLRTETSNYRESKKIISSLSSDSESEAGREEDEPGRSPTQRKSGAGFPQTCMLG